MGDMKKFDATLTKAEREAKTFLEWPDSTIARCVRATAKLIKDEKGDKAMFIQAAVNILAAVMDETNAETLKIETKGDRPKCQFELKLVATLKRTPIK